MILQTILVMLKSVPAHGNKLLLIGTISDRDCLDGLQLGTHFDHQFELPHLGLADFNNITQQQ